MASTVGTNKLDDAESLRALMERRATGKATDADARLFPPLRASLLDDAALAKLVPALVRESRSLDDFWAAVKAHPSYDDRRRVLREAFAPLFEFLEAERRATTTEPKPPFVTSIDDFLSRVVQLLMVRGDARAVSILTAGRASFLWDDHDQWGQWILRIALPAKFYSQLDEKERTACEGRIDAAAGLVDRGSSDEYIKRVSITVHVDPLPKWRDHAKAWLKGEGINNQGRVRTNNLPSREIDGLLFRSMPEVQLYRAFKDAGVAFAPLPVFLRGGKTYQRIEPDFVVIRDHGVLIVEVDGDTVHVESPAEADQRTRIFKYEGALIERVLASECDTPEKATACAQRLLAAFDRWLRGKK